jgi:hypothetical protein
MKIAGGFEELVAMESDFLSVGLSDLKNPQSGNH